MRLDGADNRPDTNQHLDAGEGIMSPPVRDLDDGPSKDGPLNYAPKKVQSSVSTVGSPDWPALSNAC